jgi:hypothetical protein
MPMTGMAHRLRQRRAELGRHASTTSIEAAITMRGMEEFAAPAHRRDAREQEPHVLSVVDEVEALAVDDQKRRRLVRVEVPAVRIGEPRQVWRGDPPLETDAARCTRSTSVSTGACR